MSEKLTLNVSMDIDKSKRTADLDFHAMIDGKIVGNESRYNIAAEDVSADYIKKFLQDSMSKMAEKHPVLNEFGS